MKKTLSFLFLAIAMGLLAQFHGWKWEENRDSSTISTIQDDFIRLDGRLGALLKSIQEEEVSFEDLNDLWQQEGIGLVIYNNGIASSWTSNAVPFPTTFEKRTRPKEGLIQLKNAWYLCKQTEDGNQVLVIYAMLTTDYNFENRYIENQWGPSINGTQQYSLTLSDLNTYPLLYTDGSTAAYVRVSTKIDDGAVTWSAGLWLLFIVFVILTFWYAADQLEKGVSRSWSTWLFVGLLLVFRLLMLWWKLPKGLYALELFGPSLHASSALVPSLGDFLLHLVFSLIAILRIHRLGSGHTSTIRHWIGVCVPVLLLWPVHYLFEILVVNSSFSLDLNNPFSLDAYSFVGLLVSFLILFNYFLLFRFLFNMVAEEDRKLGKLIIPWGLSVLVVLLALGMDSHAILVAVTGGSILGVLMLAQNGANKMHGLSLYTPTIVLFSLLATILLSFEQHENEQESRKALARNLQLQQNPITEYLFGDLEKKIGADRGLRNTLAIVPMEQETVLKALHQPFTYDHWNLYQTIIHVFNTDGGLMISDEKLGGQNYFEMQREFNSSKPTHSKNLHYVGNWGTEGGYLARIELKGRRGGNDWILFVRLIPERTDNILGFTDLFVDEGISTAKKLEGYSHALYTNGELQGSSGDFSYSLSASSYEGFTAESSFWDNDGYSHLVHRPLEDRLVIVSRRNDGLIGYLTIFSYLFLFYFVCITLIVLIEGRAVQDLIAGGSFRSRINVAMSSVLFVSLLIIGLLTVFYVVREYHARNEEMISEKSRSVLIELEHKLRDRNAFEASDQAMLSTLLNKFSKVFFTDINLYRLDGHLLATSRQRLFDEGLMASIMEPTAYTQMRFNQQSSFIQEETIGNLTYLTAYVPFRNEQREVIAFMSLPYFARQYGLQQEVFSLLAALTNIYVFLILLSVVMALIISNRITEPLRFIRESLRNLKLDQQNRTIEWNSNDEIGELVQEYNRTLNELVQSAELLARSERESAWREMAKQVAHEIKNPLTPMKLSIQMLQRSMADGAEDINERIKKVSDTLIEQIDTLSNIATEFSSFAQMPRPVIEELDLNSLLENIAELHGNSEAEIHLNMVVEESCVIQADKEQILRVFNNLIKNGIQAIPDDRKGKITLGLIRDGARWVASVQDNGTGIPEDLEEKIFVPNFTTKSAGMGLGLAMVKNIIETVNGKIWFRTEHGIGTTFYVSFPAI